MRAPHAGTPTPDPVGVLEVCWPESRAVCVLDANHCWHVQMVVMAIPVEVLHGARSCCWCGLSQTCRVEEGPVEHGPFRPELKSVLDLSDEGRVPHNLS